MAGWAGAGVNHVLIFEVDPRNHLSYQTLMQIASFMIMLWSFAVLAYLYAHMLGIPPFAPPLALMVVCVVLLLNPIAKPDSLFHRNSRFWLLKHCYKCFTSPFHFVTFTDFWLGDQMNSLTTAFLDFQYFVCFYSTEVDYSDGWIKVNGINSSTGSVPWGKCGIVNPEKTQCASAAGLRSLMSVIPAMIRFLQCLRRYRDTKRVHPHLVNAGKYSTTFFVVACGALNKYYEAESPNSTSIFFYIWILSYIMSFTYTFLWDIFMDWGLIDPRHRKKRDSYEKR
uniref:EXS domain-containing protein n=1 Tax=Caenorhabditis japonica TaxID=281687 RepID=A0A8R1ELJ5_CAEJA